MTTSEKLQIVDHCEECGGELIQGQSVWKVGENLLCTRACMLNYVGAVTITAGEE
ncbi:hypothetical protein P9G84_22535 [Brevibacillus centrosporus]|uniref:hypothetical protein n=1 Tax=Brevibacillus centrosporus TaxID=54910 RepID=UPI0011717307|nr:hypothetical protein [Brevibacillus centrosporus]MEC2131707.1 hypothetical protein [Brevibacillus centrosporus]GED33994.1 hypothetical protein BCE02nite_51350 [Brevibacillus centrosporus]